MSEIAFSGTAQAAPNRTFATWLGGEMRDGWLIYALLSVFVLYSVTLSALRGDDFLPLLIVYLERTGRALAVVACAAFTLVAVRVLMRRPERPSAEIVRTLIALASNGNLPRLLFSFSILALFMAAFLYQKMLIPEIRPFDWDATFIAWDQALFGGRHPWEMLQPWLGYPAMTMLLDYIYSSWVPFVFVFWGWMAVAPKVTAQLRRQYWMATLLSWTTIGIGMAIFFSSAGPCFLPSLFPELAAPYDRLNAYLADVNERFMLGSTLAKEFLWSAHIGAVDEPGGISAMPSMHNAQAVLFVLAAYRVNRRFGHAMSVYAILIFIGSIHLAWHYAVDGIVGGTAAVVVWHLSRLLVSSRAEARAA
jgi:hypothetical protein